MSNMTIGGTGSAATINTQNTNGSTSSMPVDIGSLIQGVLRESYQDINEDLLHFANKVKNFNATKAAIREEITAAGALATGVASQDGDHVVPGSGALNTFSVGPDGKVADTTANGANMTKDQLEQYIKDMETTLSSVGDDAQLANVDLQNRLQKQQQTLQLMSSVSKMLHDTGMAIIRKIG